MNSYNLITTLINDLKQKQEQNATGERQRLIEDLKLISTVMQNERRY